MRRSALPLCVLLGLVLAGPSLFSQQPPPAPTAGAPQAPAGRGGRGGGAVRSPEVLADGRVTFRLRAPNAKEVAVNLGGNALPMQKDEQGVWSATSNVLAPNYYTYSISVDGTSINDPNNRQVQTSFTGFQSMFIVPGPEPWFPAPNVPRGTIARHRFHSNIANDDRDFFVYTPAGYDPRRGKAYPVLYLLHGLGDDAERWMNGGAANVVLDNLIAQGKAVPMVLVTTLGYGTSAGPNGAMGEIVTGYTKILLEEVMPLVQKSYHVSANREERAMAGLSMGGAETLYAGLNHLDRFAWLGSFSGAFVMWPRATPAATGAPAAAAPAPVSPPAAGAAPAPNAGRGGRGGPPLDDSTFELNFPALTAKANARIKYLFIACGTADSLLGVNRQFKTWLKAKGVQFTEEEAPDMGHVWPLWRKNFADFAQKVFK